MAGIVDTESDRKDDIDAGYDIDGYAPEVEEADEVDEGEEDGGEDEDAEAEAAKEEEGDDKHGQQGEPKVPPELATNDLVRLPGGVHQRVAERCRQSGVFDDRLDGVPSRRVLVRPREDLISDSTSRGEDLRGWRSALQRFFKLEIRLEAGAQRGEEEGGDVVTEALASQLLPGSILGSKLCLKLCPPAVESLDVLALLLKAFESSVQSRPAVQMGRVPGSSVDLACNI